MHQRRLKRVHEVHASGYVESHLQPLLQSDLWDALPLLMKHLKQSASVTELSHNHWLLIITDGSAQEHDAVGVVQLNQGLHFSLEVLRQLVVLDETLNLQLLDGHVCKLVLRLEYKGRRSFSYLLRVLKLSCVDLAMRSGLQDPVDELHCQVLR